MNPNRLNAAQLLMNFSAHENGRICQKIYDTEFSQELQSVACATQPGEGAGPDSAISFPGSIVRSIPEALLPESQSLLALAQVERAMPTNRQGNESMQSQPTKSTANRLKAVLRRPVQTSKPQNGEQPIITNPLLLDKILAQLQLPAEARQRCTGNLNEQGHISIDAIYSVLAGGTNGTRSETLPPVVPASDVQELVNSIKSGSTNGGTNDLKLKKDGVYTLEEIRDILKPLVQGRQRKAASKTVQRSGEQTTAAQGTEAEVPIEPQGGEAPEGHVERLSRSRLPSFSAASTLRPPGTTRRSLSKDEQEASEVQAAAHRSEATSDSMEEVSHPASPVTYSPRNDTRFVEMGGTSFEPAPATPSSERTSAAMGAQDTILQSNRSPMPAEQPGSVPLASEQIIRTTPDPNPAARQEQIPGNLTVALNEGAGEDQIGEGPGNVEGLNDATADFRIESPASGDSPFDGLNNTNSESSSPNQREQEHQANASHGSQDTLTDPSPLKNETVFSVQASPNNSAARSPVDERAERVNIHQADWTQKVSEQVMERVRTGRSSLVVEFEPQDLGHMTLRIEADQHHITAWISTQSEEARTLLIQNASALQKHLAEHGLSLGQFTVSVSDQRGNARGSAEDRGLRRPSRITGKRNGDVRNDILAPGIHSENLASGSSQIISLFV